MDDERDLLAELEALESQVQAATTERDTARAETEKLRSGLRARGETLRQLESQLLELESERAGIRRRVEQLIARIDALKV